jgi:hypothetical protein
LSVAYLMKLFAGAGVASLDFAKAEACASGQAPDAEAQQLLRAQAIEISAGVKDASAEAVRVATETLNAKVTDVEAKLSVANTELGALRTTNAALLESSKTLEASVAAADSVVHASLSAMCVALKQAEPKAELKGAELLAEHKRVADEFAAKFPGQRVSAAPSAESQQTPNKGASAEVPMFARVAAAARA